MWKMLSGRIRYHIICADSVLLLNALNRAEIFLEDVVLINDLELYITVYNKDTNTFIMICNKMEASIKVLYKAGMLWVFGAMFKRPVLLGLFCLLLIVFCWLPSRVLFISVTGNKDVATNLILEAAESAGIKFGVNRRMVRSEKMKNAIIEKIPQLQWAGITTSGCTAIISVKEKTTQQFSTDNDNLISSIIASSDGVIQSCTVYQGNQLCSVGQAVKAGQTLVSGYIDCGVLTKITQAKAEITALTFREIEAYSPYSSFKRDKIVDTKTVFSIQIGKKLIKFYKDSGNCSISCDKIYEEKYVCLPGSLALPIAVIKETINCYDLVADEDFVSDSTDWIADSVRACLKDKMIAGEIISEESDIHSVNGAYYLYGRYACLEMIGQVKFEQTIIGD